MGLEVGGGQANLDEVGIPSIVGDTEVIVALILEVESVRPRLNRRKTDCVTPFLSAARRRVLNADSQIPVQSRAIGEIRTGAHSRYLEERTKRPDIFRSLQKMQIRGEQKETNRGGKERESEQRGGEISLKEGAPIVGRCQRRFNGGSSYYDVRTFGSRWLPRCIPVPSKAHQNWLRERRIWLRIRRSK